MSLSVAKRSLRLFDEEPGKKKPKDKKLQQKHGQKKDIPKTSEKKIELLLQMSTPMNKELGKNVSCDMFEFYKFELNLFLDSAP